MPATQQFRPEELDKAIKEESFEKLRDRIKKGQIPLTAPFKTTTPLHLIVTYPKHTELLEWILKNRPEINIEVKSDTECTPLIMAAVAGNMRSIKLLIEHGANTQVEAAYNNEKARDVLVRMFPQQVSEYDKIVKDYEDNKNSNNQPLHRKNESRSNKPHSILSSLSFFRSCLSSGQKEEQAAPLIEKKNS